MFIKKDGDYTFTLDSNAGVHLNITDMATGGDRALQERLSKEGKWVKRCAYPREYVSVQFVEVTSRLCQQAWFTCTPSGMPPRQTVSSMAQG